MTQMIEVLGPPPCVRHFTSHLSSILLELSTSPCSSTMCSNGPLDTVSVKGASAAVAFARRIMNQIMARIAQTTTAAPMSRVTIEPLRVAATLAGWESLNWEVSNHGGISQNLHSA